ncbi:MAG: DUF1834 family protein [Nitrospirae bacterium YQR-1]
MLKIAEMEAMMLNKLELISGLKTVDIYIGKIEDALSGSMKLPAALLVYSGAKADLQTEGGRGLLYNVDFRFTVFIAGKSLKSRKEAGESIKTILEDVRGSLNGLQQGSATLIWEEEGLEVMTKTGVVIYSQHYKCREALTAKRSNV